MAMREDKIYRDHLR